MRADSSQAWTDLADVLRQTEIDRALSLYEVYVWTPDPSHGVSDHVALLATGGHA